MMEHIRTPKVENVRLLDRSAPRKAGVGTLYLSATHTIFVENNPETRRETWVLHSMVASVERPPTTPAGSQLVIRCKNFLIYHLLVPQERDCMDLHVSLTRLSRPEKYAALYCLSFNPSLNKQEREESWDFLDVMEDYRHMGVPNNLWVTTAANSEYRVCDTYPAELFVPRSATPSVIVGSSKFRSRGRFPALTYFHQDTLAAICRCSQPLSGFSGRCQDDEQMLQAIMKSNPGSDVIYVVDTRPKLNAMANRAAGKGYENEDHYTNIKLNFIGIENIHVMRSSQQKVMDVGELRTPSMGDFLWGLESSGWLKHIKAVLDAGVFIAKAIADEGVSVLVHCSDGWDRTAQACSVASILLDPYYRTIRGLMLLIERDWISFGHKFSHRYSHLEGDPREVSPVMDQFLECVWQLSEQFPCAFEYNEHFLVQIHTHVYSCQYGSFLGNSQKERRDLRLRERTHSVWIQLWRDRAEYLNPLYRADHSQTQGVLRPNTTPYCFKMWKGMYNRSEKAPPPRQSPSECLTAMREESQQLEQELANHQERIAALRMTHTQEERKVEERERKEESERGRKEEERGRKEEERGRKEERKEEEKERKVERRETPEEDIGPCLPPPSNQPITTLPQDTSPSLLSPDHAHPGLILPLEQVQVKGHDPDDLWACSDPESGVADLSSSSSGCDLAKAPAPDEAALYRARTQTALSTA